jgi:hypothetical protein
MKIPSPYRSYPPHWATFDTYVFAAGAQRLGFVGTAADVNRFAARYRAAKCFKSVEFDELTQVTADGYSALMSLLLTYSAFEHLLHCIGTALPSTTSLLSESEREALLARLRSLHGQAEVFRAASEHLNPSFQRQIASHLREELCNPFYLAGGLRHAFAHGKLTATPGAAPQAAVATVCRFMCRALMRVMDREFRSRVMSFEGVLSGGA